MDLCSGGTLEEYIK
jgi:serine/threonine protein kinase